MYCDTCKYYNETIGNAGGSHCRSHEFVVGDQSEWRIDYLIRDKHKEDWYAVPYTPMADSPACPGHQVKVINTPAIKKTILKQLGD